MSITAGRSRRGTFIALAALAVVVSGVAPTTARAATARHHDSPTATCTDRGVYTSPVRDPGFPSALEVCSDRGSQDALHQPAYAIRNGTDNVWTVRSDSAVLGLSYAAPDGPTSARVAVFRQLMGIDQTSAAAGTRSWVIEPGTSAVVRPGFTAGLLEVSRRHQGAWADYLALESVASKAGTNLADLIRNEKYGKAVNSCVGAGFAAFDLSPTAPTTTATLQADLSATLKGTQCIADLDVADRERGLEYRAGRTRTPTISGSSLSEELSRSASRFDTWLARAGKVLAMIPR